MLILDEADEMLSQGLFISILFILIFENNILIILFLSWYWYWNWLKMILFLNNQTYFVSLSLPLFYDNRFQRTNLRRVPLFATTNTSKSALNIIAYNNDAVHWRSRCVDCCGVGDNDGRCVENDEKVYDGSDPHPRETRWIDAGRHQTVLCGGGERRVEIRHVVRPVRHAHHHTGGHLLQHTTQGKLTRMDHACHAVDVCVCVCVCVLGWLVDGEDARRQLHCGCHARRNAARRAWRDHDVRSLSSLSHLPVIVSIFVFTFSCFVLVRFEVARIVCWSLLMCGLVALMCNKSVLLSSRFVALFCNFYLFFYCCVKISLVINYDLPNNRELYIHRIGRSGRWGRKG